MKKNYNALLKSNLLLDIFFFALCTLCLYLGIQATSDLTTAFDPDLYRDTGYAKNILAGRFFNDPQILDEFQWYNPLAPSLIAIISRLTGLDPSIAYARAGALLNLLPLITFYILAIKISGRRTAFIAIIALLFVVPINNVTPYLASYSPWFYSYQPGLLLFCLTLISYINFSESPSQGKLFSTGLLWGLTFLAHTFPALLFGLFMLYSTCIKKTTLKTFSQTTAIAFLVSLPFSYTLIFQYQFEVKNSEPTGWVFSEIQDLLAYLKSFFSWHTPLVALGVVYLFLSTREKEKTLLKPLFIIIFLWLLYISSIDNIEKFGLTEPFLNFSMHVSIYFSLVLSYLFAIGVSRSVDFISEKISITENQKQILTLLLASIPVGMNFEDFKNRDVFQEFPLYAKNQALFLEASNAKNWIESNTSISDVIIASPWQSLSIITPTGRKTIATPLLHANPYVDAAVRLNDLDLALDAINSSEWHVFLKTADAYSAKYILFITRQKDFVLPAAYFKKKLANAYVEIYQIDYSLTPGG